MVDDDVQIDEGEGAAAAISQLQQDNVSYITESCFYVISLHFFPVYPM